MTYEVRSLNEEYGVFGIQGHPQAVQVTYSELHSPQHRDREGAGIVTNDNDKLLQYRNTGPLSEVFKNPADLEKLAGTAAIGHVRYTTTDLASIDNIQPFLYNFTDEQFGLCHNGNLTNAVSLKEELEDQGAIFNVSSNTEILMHLIRRSHNPEFIGKVKEALNTVGGGFAYLLITEDKLITVLNPNGLRSLPIGQMTNGAWIVLSKTYAFEVVGVKWVRDVKSGGLVIIDDNGIQYDTYTNDTQLAICPIEYIYSARPDSDIYGISVHTAYKNMGKRLVQEFQYEADAVVGAPNSSPSTVMGSARESGLLNEVGLVKNQYTQRTFIQSTQELREQGVHMKLSAVPGIVKGKCVVMVDDSIVHGTTSRRTVRLLREAGMTKVYAVIGNPKLKYPCSYGVGIQSRRELISTNHTKDEVCGIAGADGLAYLSTGGLIESIDLDIDAPNGGLYVAYSNGKYPTPLYDYEEPYLKSLEEETSFYTHEVSESR